MKIESVRLLRTLKAGQNVWREGTVFPNRRSPVIPKEILGEAIRRRETVEILVQSEDDAPIHMPSRLRNEDGRTSTSDNVLSEFGTIQQPNEEQSPSPNTVQRGVPKEVSAHRDASMRDVDSGTKKDPIIKHSAPVYKNPPPKKAEKPEPSAKALKPKKAAKSAKKKTTLVKRKK